MRFGASAPAERATRGVAAAILILATGTLLPACDDATSSGGSSGTGGNAGSSGTGGSGSGASGGSGGGGQSDAGTLPGCAEYCDHQSTVCGMSERSCLVICSQVNRDEKLHCLDSLEALNRCYAASGGASCDGGIPTECVDEIGRLSSCFETDGGSATGCVKTFGGGTCRGDFVDGRTAQKTCYPGVPVPQGCISVGEILALRGFPDERPPATNPDGTLVDSAVVCCAP